MQPYFFPYIGYWQLIHAVDGFVLLDDVQYMRHGWINRNRILKPGEGWQYVMMPLQKHAMTDVIRDIRVREDEDWRRRLLAQLDHYRKLTRHFTSVRDLVQSLLNDDGENRVAYINMGIMKRLCAEWGLERQFWLASEMNLDYSAVSQAGDWAPQITRQLGGSQYINPVGGVELFDANQFAACHVELKFLRSRAVVYPQRGAVFESALSIIDVLMFNGIDGTLPLLQEYDVISDAEAHATALGADSADPSGGLYPVQ